MKQGIQIKPLSPNNISVPLEFHLDGKNANSFSLDGTSVDQWNDLSGNDRHVLNGNGDATRPTYDASTGRVTFTAANSTFLQSAAFGSALSQPNTIFVVYKITGNTGDNERVFCGRGSWGNIFGYSSNKYFIGSAALWNGATNANDNIHVGLFNGASSKYWVNGILKVSGDVGVLSLDGITLGVKYNLSSNYADCEIMEVIGYNSILPIAENYGIFLGLKDKWSI